MADYAEQLFDAVSILTESYTDNLDFNKTIKATIVDDSQASSGVYSASDGSLTFTAYSSDTSYVTGDRVYVIIPNNNTSNQRMILGKIISAGQAQYVSTNVFSSYVDISDNLIDDNLSGELIANQLDDDKQEKLLWSHGFATPVSDYNKLGIKASFRTWLGGYGLVSGDYGLRLDITTVDSMSEIGQTYSMYFSCNDMDGSIYNFSSYHSQQALFDIENINNIKYLNLYFYQDGGSFIDEDGEGIPTDNTIPDLFVKGLYLSFGYNKDKLSSNVDSVVISTNDFMSYTLNESKYISLSWLHWSSDGTCKVVKEDDDLNYEVRWYKYALDCGDADDLYMNKNWQKLETTKTARSINFVTNKVNQAEQIRAVIICPSSTTSGEQTIYSNTLVFENTKQTVNPVLAESGLTINCLDDSGGNYYLYGTGNIILNQSDANQVRTLDLTFTQGNDVSINILSDDVNYETKWEFGYIDADGNNCTDSSMFEVLNDPPVNPLQLNYKIKDYYSSWQTYNTIKCTVTLPDTGYTISAVKELKFGVAGTQGADATLLISFKDSYIKNWNYDVTIFSEEENKTDTYFQSALRVGETTCDFKVQLFDSANKEVDLTTETITWSIVNGSTSGYTITAQTPSNFATLSNVNGFKQGDLVFIQAKLEESKQCNYTLTSSFPVPITNNIRDYSYLNGITQVVYSMAGLPLTYTTPYNLFNYTGKKYDNVEWIIYPSDIDDVSITDNILKPSQIYIKNSNLYGVQAKINNEIVWSQPILVSQNAFFSSTINQWDGTTVDINVGEGTIVGRSFAAGRKENNTFSGVLLGDWKDESEIELTGVYGVQNGELSYGFKEDGTAFIGKTSSAQIMFDGNESLIYSLDAKFDNEIGSYIDLKTGRARFLKNLTIDQNGKVTIGSAKNGIVISADTQTIKGGVISLDLGEGTAELGTNFKVDSGGKVTIGSADSGIIIDSSTQTIQGTNTIIDLINGTAELGTNFKVDSGGKVTIGSAKKGIVIDSSTQTIQGTNTTIDLNSGAINMGNGNFAITANGDLTLKGDLTATKLIATEEGTIGGWTINGETGLQNANGTVYLKTDGFKLGDYFLVNSSGAKITGTITATTLTTSSGTIGGWTIGSTGLTYGDSKTAGYFSLTSTSFQLGTNFKVDTSGNVTMGSATIDGNFSLNTKGKLNGIYGVLFYKATGKSIGKQKGKTFKLSLSTIINSIKKSTEEETQTIQQHIRNNYRPVAVTKIWTNHSTKCKLGGYNVVYDEDNKYIGIRLINTGSTISENLTIAIKILFLKTNEVEDFGIIEPSTDLTTESNDETSNEETDSSGNTLTPVYLEKEDQTFTKNIFVSDKQSALDNALVKMQWINKQDYATATYVNSAISSAINAHLEAKHS